MNYVIDTVAITRHFSGTGKIGSTISTIQKKPCYIIVDLNIEIILHAESIQFYELHDRLILGTVKYLGLPVLSSDERFDELDQVIRIW